MQEVLKLSQDQKKQLAGARREYLQALGPILDKQQALLSMLEVRVCRCLRPSQLQVTANDQMSILIVKPRGFL